MTIIACDIGATEIKGARYEDAIAIQTQRLRTEPERGAHHTMNQLHKLIGQLWTEEVRAIGIVSAGAINPTSGMIVGNTGTMTDWVGVSLKADIETAFGVPVHVDNDANGAMLAEFEPYRKAGIQHAVMLTLGTGVGSAVVIHGELYRGATYQVEFGHLILHPGGRPCTCGQTGCAEQYLSGRALTNRAIAEVDGAITHGSELFLAATQQNPRALAVLEEYFDDLFLYLQSLDRVYDPELFLIGGGVTDNNNLFATMLEEKRLEHCFTKPIHLARLQNRAGIQGAYLLAERG